MAVVDVMVYTQRCNAVPRDLLDNLIYIYIYINPSSKKKKKKKKPEERTGCNMRC
jgi:hypothetical protein